MRLNRATPAYDREDQDRLRADLEREDERNRKVGQDIALSSDRIILTALDGSRWAITVSNAGVLDTESVA